MLKICPNSKDFYFGKVIHNIFCLNHHVYKSGFFKYDEEAFSTKKDIFRREKITFPVNNHMISI